MCRSWVINILGMRFRGRWGGSEHSDALVLLGVRTVSSVAVCEHHAVSRLQLMARTYSSQTDFAPKAP